METGRYLHHFLLVLLLNQLFYIQRFDIEYKLWNAQVLAWAAAHPDEVTAFSSEMIQ